MYILVIRKERLVNGGKAAQPSVLQAHVENRHICERQRWCSSVMYINKNYVLNLYGASLK